LVAALEKAETAGSLTEGSRNCQDIAGLGSGSKNWLSALEIAVSGYCNDNLLGLR
jgi:hypothetical protein